jgi:hypothetical protein
VEGTVNVGLESVWEREKEKLDALR